MYSTPQVDWKLPPESDMNRTDALDAFRVVLNCVRPEHPFQDEPYPASRDEIDFGVTRSSHAQCGPRRQPNVALYQTRLTHIHTLSREEHLALLTHEISHITVCSRATGHTSGHPPAFWREMAFHALELRDAIRDGVLESVFGALDIDEYLIEVANNPCGATVDRRYWSVEACRERMRELLQIQDRALLYGTTKVRRLRDE